MSSSLSYLTTLYAGLGDTSGTASLLDTLYGNGGAGQVADSGGSPIAALASAEKNEATQVKTTASEATVKNAMTAYTKAVNSGRSLDQILSDPSVLNVLLTANGLSDQIGNTALAKKVLTSNLSDPNSLANVLTDSRWKTLAQTYNLNVNGIKALNSPSVISAITQGYAQMTWEQAQDATTPGLSDALTFIQEAPTITSVDQILGNVTVRNVVTTALGIPQQIAFQSLTAQETAISSRLDVKNFQSPSFVQSFAQRFLIENNLNTSNTSSQPDLTTLAVEAGG
jgi:hypothetical protein